MTEIMLEQQGPDGFLGIFSEDDGAGYLCIYKPEENMVLAQVQVYDGSAPVPLQEKDVLVMWSADEAKCGVTLRGWMHGIIDIRTGSQICAPLTKSSNEPITATEWLEGFDRYLDQKQFTESRGRYWREVAKQYKPDLRSESDLAPLETNFILYERGPDQQFCTFEDDGDTGYLYLYNAEKQQVVRHLHVYDYPKSIGVTRHDVDVVWSEDYAKCGVIIWGKMRGIIDRLKQRERRVKLEHRDSPGIGDKEWLKGFEYLRESISRQ